MSKSNATACDSDVRRASAFQVAMLILETMLRRTASDQEVTLSDPPRHTARQEGPSGTEGRLGMFWTNRVSEGRVYLGSNSSCCICFQYKCKRMKSRSFFARIRLRSTDVPLLHICGAGLFHELACCRFPPSIRESSSSCGTEVCIAAKLCS